MFLSTCFFNRKFHTYAKVPKKNTSLSGFIRRYPVPKFEAKVRNYGTDNGNTFGTFNELGRYSSSMFYSAG